MGDSQLAEACYTFLWYQVDKNHSRILLYHLRSLNRMYILHYKFYIILYYTYSTYMKCFFPSLLPALRVHPSGGEPSAAGSDEGDCHITWRHIRLCTIAWNLSTQQASKRRLSHTHTYTHTYGMYTIHVRWWYRPFNCMYVTHWYTYILTAFT